MMQPVLVDRLFFARLPLRITVAVASFHEATSLASPCTGPPQKSSRDDPAE
jgi:hypothetical protein